MTIITIKIWGKKSQFLKKTKIIKKYKKFWEQRF